MLLPSLITVLILLAPVAYVAWRKFSVVEQHITFDTPQRGVASVSVVVQEDLVQKLRIIYDDGQICEVFPAAAKGTASSRAKSHGRTHRDPRTTVAEASSRR